MPTERQADQAVAERLRADNLRRANARGTERPWADYFQVRIIYGQWDRHGVWHPNPCLCMTGEEQRQANIAAGYDMSPRRPEVLARITYG